MALLAKLNGISMIDAAKEIILQHTSAGPVTKRPSWKQRVEALREIIKQADTYTGKYSVETAALAWDDPIFRAAIMAKQEACQELDQLYEGGRA